MLGLFPPRLHTVWRVPVSIAFLHQGRCPVGTMDVDARSGAILDQGRSIAAIQARAAELAAGLPPYTANRNIVPEFLAPDPIMTLKV